MSSKSTFRMSTTRKQSKGLEKKPLLLCLSTNAFSNWRGKPLVAKHKLHPNGFCLYLLNSTKEKSNEISTNVVSFVYYIYTVFFEQKFYFLQMGRREWPGASACLPALQNGVIVSYENKQLSKTSVTLQKAGGTKRRRKKEKKVL